jgi:hypothetical protein
MNVQKKIKYQNIFSNVPVGQIFKNVEFIAAIGVMLRSFPQLASLARGVSIRMLRWLVGARLPLKHVIFKFDEIGTRVTRLGNFFANWATLKFQNWFVVDVLGFQIELCCRYF